MNSVYFITLGCSKNDVDTSQMKLLLDENKYDVADGLFDANIIIVNTCGFIDAAKEESIDTIIEAAQYKTKGNCKKLILAGCLAQRYSNELLEEIPEIDGIIGTGNLSNLNEVLDNALKGDKEVRIDNINSNYIEGLYKSEVNITEYVKISEGCNNFCSYCIIPRLRGKNRSRKIEDIYKEVSHLVKKGTREIILIAQNTTDYGIDIYGKYMLSELIREISKIEDLHWIRVLYLYPDHFTEDLINEFINNDKLLKYVDIPLQHISDNVLQKMNRKTDKNHIENLLINLRKRIPEIIIRTTFIVGFPGETQEDFIELRDFIERIKFDKLGVFIYSREEGTPAFGLKNQVEEDEKQVRLDEIMSNQENISEGKLTEKIGKIYEVLVEENLGNGAYSGRSYMDAPEIDGIIYINSNRDLSIGSFIKVKINDSMEYDLIGEEV